MTTSGRRARPATVSAAAGQRRGAARRADARALRAFQRPYRRGAGRPGLDHRPVGRRGSRRPGLWPGHLRHEGRARGRDRCRGDLARMRPPAAGGAGDLGHGRRGIRRFRRRRVPGRAGAVLQAAGRPRHHSRAANVDRVCIGHRGVWWAEIETHGRIAHGSMPFLGDCAVRHMACRARRVRARAVAAVGAAADRDAGGARRRAQPRR